jgi:hypothetical protein
VDYIKKCLIISGSKEQSRHIAEYQVCKNSNLKISRVDYCKTEDGDYIYGSYTYLDSLRGYKFDEVHMPEDTPIYIWFDYLRYWCKPDAKLFLLRNE